MRLLAWFDNACFHCRDLLSCKPKARVIPIGIAWVRVYFLLMINHDILQYVLIHIHESLCVLDFHGVFLLVIPGVDLSPTPVKLIGFLNCLRSSSYFFNIDAGHMPRTYSFNITLNIWRIHQCS